MPWLRSNTGLKLIALLLAVCTWLFVKGITSDWRTIDGVPVEVRIKSGLTALKTSVSTVNVTVRGTREDVRQVSRQDLSALVDLTRDPRRGLIAVELTPKDVRHSRRVQVTQIEPSEVTVNVDEIIERELPVQPQFTGELPPSLAIERVITKPDKIVVKGPKTLLNNMSAVATLPIDVTGRRTSFRERVELTPLRLPEELAERRWVEVDVRIAMAASIDTAPSRGVEEKP